MARYLSLLFSCLVRKAESSSASLPVKGALRAPLRLAFGATSAWPYADAVAESPKAEFLLCLPQTHLQTQPSRCLNDVPHVKGGQFRLPGQVPGANRNKAGRGREVDTLREIQRFLPLWGALAPFL